MTHGRRDSLTGTSALWPLIRPRRRLLCGALGLIVIARAAGLVLPLSTKFLVEDVIAKKHVEVLYSILGIVLAATLIQSLSSYFVTQLLSKTSSRLIAEYRIRLQSHISRLPLSYHDSNRTGATVSRIMNDVEGIRNLFGNGLIEFAGGLLTGVLAFGFMLWINPRITLVAAACLGLFGLVQRKLLGILVPTARERGRIAADITGRLNESLAGVRVIKSYRAEERESSVFAQGIQRLLHNILATTNKSSVVSALSTGLIGLIATLIMLLGVREILAGTLSLANYLTLTVLLAFLVSPVSQVVAVGTQLAEAIAGLQRSQQILQESVEDDDPRRTVSIDRARTLGYLQFENVSFAYLPGKRVLHDLSFEARPGTVTALVGSSGSGKSTIIGLTCAFYNPGRGRILLDGVDLSTIQLESYRRMLGVVLQESFLFEGTIHENIAFAKPGASTADVIEAARIARVDEFTDRLPLGFETIVGERGIKLSGGQRQRVSIARAILADPRILILDEATSSLDSESETLIQAGLSHLIEGRTTFVIAHRLSTIHKADQILVVEDGQIVERGRHIELYRHRGRYYDLYTRQHALEKNLFLGPGEGDLVATASSIAADGSSVRG